MIATLRATFYKHGYLLIIAAWLYTISFVITNYWAYDSSPTNVKEKLENKIASAEKEIYRLEEDSVLLQTLIADTSNKKLALLHKPFGVFLYTFNDVGSPILNYWNSNLYTITPNTLEQRDDDYFVTQKNGEQEIIKRTLLIKGKPLLLIAVIPIRWSYFITNKYLHKDFDEFPELSEQYDISTDNDAVPILNGSGNVLFKLKQKEGHIYAGYDFFTVLLRLCGVLLIILFINRITIRLIAAHGLLRGMVFMVGVVLLLRIITYYFAFPFDYSRLSLFDPSIYASNFLHPSLGHLFINVILLFWVVGIYKFNSINYLPSPLYTRLPWLGYFNIAFLVFILFITTTIIGSLVQDSKISFDVTHFFSLNIYSVISFITLSFMPLVFYHLSHILLRPVFALTLPLSFQLLVAVVVGFSYIHFTISPSSSLFIIATIWLVGYLILANYRQFDIQFSIQKSSFFLFWVMVFALSITFVISWQNKVVDIAQRKKVAERLALQNDANGANVLSIAVSNININVINKSYSRLLTEASNKQIKDSILNENFTGYLNKFETSIYTFNQYYEPLFNEDTTLNYASLTAIISVRSKPTAITNLYAWDNSSAQVTYIYSVAIGAQDKPQGYFFIVARSKKYKSEALYPVLFSQAGEEDNLSGQNQYGQAIYINGRLISKQNDYDFPLSINSDKLLPYDYAIHTNSDSEELWYNAGNGKTIIIAKSNTRIVEVITLFAYLFFTLLVVISFFHLGSFIIRSNFSIATYKKLFNLNIQSQIHATVIFISVFSFVVIGSSTISFFTSRFNTFNSQRLSATIESIANEITVKLHQIQSQKLLDDGISMYDVGYLSNFERDITEVSEVHNVDVNFYSLSGNLIASTQPHIYSKQLLNTRINPNAFYHLQYDKRTRYVQTETIGELKYLSIYMPVLDDAGKVYAYINIPYLNSQIELNQEISSFIATIINLNAFIFLIAGVIAYVLTQRVVASFSIIANKMKEVNIGKKNETIVWEKNDEIGELVKEYNKMVEKLEESADALARSEREGAWREMAKQVAHEIKNPLTPMKLSIQYLQRAVDNDLPNAKELSQRVATTLIDQIDQLAKIASDFSQFANIDNAVIEPIDISEKLAGIVQLYQQTESAQITYQKQPAAIVMGDKTQVSRLFTNLIKNAIESVDSNGICHITINQTIADKYLLITIKDDGKGIPKEIIDHIFQPNFTTKTSGTGLGLAISKGIVEKMKGTISFETEAGEGTTFIIQLPLKA